MIRLTFTICTLIALPLLAQPPLADQARAIMQAHRDFEFAQRKKMHKRLLPKRKKLISTLEKGRSILAKNGETETTRALDAAIQTLQKELSVSRADIRRREALNKLQQSIAFGAIYHYPHPSGTYKHQRGKLRIDLNGKAQLTHLIGDEVVWHSADNPWLLKNDHLLIKMPKNNIIIRPKNSANSLKMIWYGQFEATISAYLDAKKVAPEARK